MAVGASNTVVKGLVINRFRGTGIAIQPSDADLLSNVKIEGNFIGTNPAGTAKRRNINGVIFTATTKSTIGGTSLASRNLISGNNGNGVASFFLGVSNNDTIRGNLIGTQKDGITALGNGGSGVLVFSSDSVGISILSNSIFETGGLGIDLGSDGVTPNDEGDPDLGSNRFQNFPELSSATTLPGTTTVMGTFNSRPLEQYTIQFFSRPSSDVGQTFIGQTSVFTDGSGNASFSFSPGAAIAVGQQVTATATRKTTGDTSEISAPQMVTGS